MKLNILGSTYNVVVKRYSDIPDFAQRSICGYCNGITREIVICDPCTLPGWENETPEGCELFKKQILRHEIVHAFFDESGLMESTFAFDGPWSRNEEMVDWFASQGPKIFEAWRKAKCL